MPGEIDLVNPKIPLDQRAGDKSKSIYSYQVWLRDGSLLMNGTDAPTTKPLMNLAMSGFDSVSINGEMSRVFSLPAPSGSVVIQVAEPLRERADDVKVTLGIFLATLILPFGVSMGATWYLLRRSFRALDAMAEQMRQHHLLDTGPMMDVRPATELTSVFQAVNSLFHRTGNALAMEQKFTSMAAHELRTPWAGIRAQAQIACRARTNEELQEALREVVTGVDRASHVFDQLLDLTRIECMSKDVSSNFQRVQLSAIYLEVMAELDSKATAKQISISAELTEESLQGLDFAIFILMRNLISNAILYTPAEGKIQICVQQTGQNIVLTVDDSGKGIPAEVRDQAFERFNRLNQQGTDGVGLGLSIVAQIVELHHAKIQLLDSPLGGLRVQVIFNREVSEQI